MLLKETKFIMLSDHFTLYELVKSATAVKMGIDNMPDENQLNNLRSLTRFILEPARITLNQPIQLSCAFRCPELNYLVHGARNSQHLSGCAADIHLKDEAYGQRLFRILSSNAHVDQLLYEHDRNGARWIHVSFGKKPRHIIKPDYQA